MTAAACRCSPRGVLCHMPHVVTCARVLRCAAPSTSRTLGRASARGVSTGRASAHTPAHAPRTPTHAWWLGKQYVWPSPQGSAPNDARAAGFKVCHKSWCAGWCQPRKNAGHMQEDVSCSQWLTEVPSDPQQRLARRLSRPPRAAQAKRARCTLQQASTRECCAKARLRGDRPDVCSKGGHASQHVNPPNPHREWL